MSDLLSLHHLALELKLPREWLREEADAGRVPCLKVGSRYLFSLRAVEKALAEQAGEANEVKPGGTTTAAPLEPTSDLGDDHETP